LTEANGVPLAALVSAANTNDITQLWALLQAVPPVQGKRGRPRRRPKKLLGDRAYDSQPHRDALQRRGIKPALARRGVPHGSGLGKERWPVERSIGWLHNARRLRVRYDRHDFIHEAFVKLQVCLICHVKLRFC
jgi:transposase